MQPTYLPWMGYFALIDAVDVFVLLDDVQFVRSSWHSRNRIKSTSSKDILLTVPVRRKAGVNSNINSMIIDDTKNWRKKHVKTFEQNYRKSPFIECILPFYKNILMDKKLTYLSALNYTLITGVRDILRIETKFLLASSLNINHSDRSLRLVEICKSVGATTYISPEGSTDYLLHDRALDIFGNNNIIIKIQNYHHPVYPQINGSFLSHLCILDVIANTGLGEALEWIRQGYHELPAEKAFANYTRGQYGVRM